MAPDRYSWAHCNNSRGVSVIRKALMVGRGGVVLLHEQICVRRMGVAGG